MCSPLVFGFLGFNQSRKTIHLVGLFVWRTGLLSFCAFFFFPYQETKRHNKRHGDKTWQMLILLSLQYTNHWKVCFFFRVFCDNLPGLFARHFFSSCVHISVLLSRAVEILMWDIVTLESGLFLESAISVSTLMGYSWHIEPYVIKNASMVHFNDIITCAGSYFVLIYVHIKRCLISFFQHLLISFSGLVAKSCRGANADIRYESLHKEMWAHSPLNKPI